MREMKHKRSIVLADCREDEICELVDSLNIEQDLFDICSHISNWKRKNVFTELRRYIKYFSVSFLYFLKKREYDMVVGWQQFYALIFAFYCNVFSVKKYPKLVALNFTYKEKKGKFARVYRWFMGKCVSEKYMSFLHVLSSDYADYISNEFAFPRERIIVTAFGIRDRYHELSMLSAPGGYEKDGYALAIGRSNRDYDFLLRAWQDINYPLVIISDTYRKQCDNDNIEIYNDITGEESNKWIANCGLMIIPIDDGSICSGDTVLLTAMSLQRRILVTVPSTLAEMYIENGVNAVLAEKDEVKFAQMVKQMLYTDAYCSLGQRARESFLGCYTISAMGNEVRNKVFNS